MAAASPLLPLPIPARPAPANPLYFFSKAKSVFRALSNFSGVTICVTLDGLATAIKERQPLLSAWLAQNGGRATFPSSEHLYQSLKARHFDAFRAFTIAEDGASDTRLGTWCLEHFINIRMLKAGLAFVSAKGGARVDARKNQKETGAEKIDAIVRAAMGEFNGWAARNMIGIQAKYAVSETHCRAFGFAGADIDFNSEWLAPEKERALWLAIEDLKYAQNAPERAILLGTDGADLIEFSRGACQTAPSKRHEHWAGALKWDAAHGALQLVGDNAMGGYLMALREQYCATPAYAAELAAAVDTYGVQVRAATDAALGGAHKSARQRAAKTTT